jgi:hypothetical protein
MSAESNSENAGPEDILASGPRVTAAVSESDMMAKSCLETIAEGIKDSPPS